MLAQPRPEHQVRAKRRDQGDCSPDEPVPRRASRLRRADDACSGARLHDPGRRRSGLCGCCVGCRGLVDHDVAGNEVLVGCRVIDLFGGFVRYGRRRINRACRYIICLRIDTLRYRGKKLGRRYLLARIRLEGFRALVQVGARGRCVAVVVNLLRRRRGSYLGYGTGIACKRGDIEQAAGLEPVRVAVDESTRIRGDDRGHGGTARRVEPFEAPHDARQRVAGLHAIA